MEGIIKQFVDWLGPALDKFSLNDEVYTGYIQGIMEEQTSTIDEKAEGIVDFLAAATVRIFIDGRLYWRLQVISFATPVNLLGDNRIEGMNLILSP
jgi:hypothetical protein